MALLPVALAACASQSTTYDADGGPRTDAGTEPAAVLELVSEPALTLLFGDDADLAVRYTEQDGSPIAGATLGLALVGRAHDSTLDELEMTTDADGVASGRVIAGHVSSAFRVRVTAPRAIPVHVDVSVGDAGFGGLVVEMSYDGERRIVERAIDVYARGSCGDTRTTTGPGDRSTTLTPGTSEARFFALPVLPAGESYAVVGRGRGPGGEMLAWGCTDAVALEADVNTSVAVAIHDLALIVDGDYSVEADLETPVPARTLAEAASTSGTEAIDAAGGDGAFLLDVLEAALRAAGLTSAADDLAMRRVAADLDAALDLRLADAGTSPSASAAVLATTLGERTERLAISGALSVADAVPVWTMSAVSAHASAPSSPRLSLDLSALGIEPDAAMSATWLLDEDAMQLDELRVTLPLGSVAVASLAALAAERRVDGTAGLLLATSGCETWQSWASEQASISAACDSECLLSACKNALEEIATRIESFLASLDAERAVITLAGRVALEDTEGDLRVDFMAGGELAGEWASPDGSAGDPVGGMLSGVRTLE